ncbi:O-antigen ligase family protein [Sphingomonas sp. 35-24ZXX]|uniref:O-antigen ligase family protein n=1 Tax=Sphingomonas sp. 35-24ZXX TaxID=1545915 RepID=UPI0018CFCCAF|nr:O-antigen ligase family protein [Sphingomonas sp. 35-24ZXX]
MIAIAPGQSIALAVRSLVAPHAKATISLDHLATTFAALQIAVFSIACFLLHRVRYRQRKALYALFAAMGAVSVIVSTTQYVSGGAVFDFYHSGHAPHAPGLFANRNHGALFLGCCLTFAGALISLQRLSAELKLGLFAALAAPALALIALSGSRAGLVISGMMALGVIMFMPRPAWGLSHSSRCAMPLRGLAAIGIVSFLAFVAFVPLSGDTASRLTMIDSDLRWSIWQRSIVLAGQYIPWGSGLGTFPAAYALIEPVNELQPFYVNHAHNDWIEAIVEAGVFALIPLAAGVVLVSQGLWANRLLDPIRRLECRTGLIVTSGLLAHSLVDYPLRTPTLALTFAFALTLVSSAIRTLRQN